MCLAEAGEDGKAAGRWGGQGERVALAFVSCNGGGHPYL